MTNGERKLVNSASSRAGVSVLNIRYVDTDLCALTLFSFFFLLLFTDRHRSVVQHTVDSQRTRIWIETGLESRQLNSEFGRNKRRRAFILYLYMVPEWVR